MLYNKKYLTLTSLIVLLPVLVGLLLWNRLPEQIPAHWNAAGEIDGWSSRPFAVFGMPAFLLAVHWICIFVTRSDPKNDNNGSKPLSIALWCCPVISLLVCVLTLGTALGWEIAVEKVMPVVLGVMFTVIGNYLPKCRQSYTLGIKLPWTLASEENWNKTHRLAGKLWTVGGVLIAVTGFTGGMISMVTILIAMVLGPTVYSWHLHKKAQK